MTYRGLSVEDLNFGLKRRFWFQSNQGTYPAPTLPVVLELRDQLFIFFVISFAIPG